MDKNKQGRIYIYEDNVKLYLISSLIDKGKFPYTTPHKEEAELFTYYERIALGVMLKLRGIEIKIHYEHEII